MFSVSWRGYVFGVVALLLLVVAPSVLQGTTSLIDIAYIASVVVVAPLALSLGFRWAERRKLGPRATVGVAYAVAAISAGLFSLVWGRVVQSFGDGLGPGGSAAIGGYLGFVVVGLWGLLVLLPAAVRRERENQELRREIERSRVRAAVEPHFVLNTLNAIAGLIGEAPETARDLVGDLGDLLRDAVELAESDVQPAAAEIAWLQRYTRILAARHQGKLAFEWSIDPAATERPMPALLLQPLVENAIRHGALQGGGHVRIAFAIVDGALRCTVEDDGPGLPAEVRDGARGLALTRRRLACDAPGSKLELTSTPNHGTRAVVHLAAA